MVFVIFEQSFGGVVDIQICEVTSTSFDFDEFDPSNLIKQFYILFNALT